MQGGDDVFALVLETSASAVRAGDAGNASPVCSVSVEAADDDAPERSERVQRAWWLAWQRLGRPLREEGEGKAAGGKVSQSGEHGSDDREATSTHPTQPVLMVEPALPWDATTRRALAQFAFYSLDVPALFFLRSAVATTFCCASVTALVLSLDDDGAIAAPVVNGYLLQKALQHEPGAVIRWHRGVSNRPIDQSPVPLSEVEHLLFPTLPRLVFDAISACDVDVRRDLFGNILVTGDAVPRIAGGALVPRLAEEMAEICPHLFKSRVAEASTKGVLHRGASPAWVGGSICASLGTFHQLWVTRDEFAAAPDTVLEERCP